MWRCILSILSLLRIFFIKKCWILSIFFCISCDDHIIFTIGLNMLYLLCILGISKTWSWYRMILVWCWNQFAILLRIVASILGKDFDLYFSYHDNLLIFLWGFPCIWSVSFLWLLCNFSLCLWFFFSFPPPPVFFFFFFFLVSFFILEDFFKGLDTLGWPFISESESLRRAW